MVGLLLKLRAAPGPCMTPRCHQRQESPKSLNLQRRLILAALLSYSRKSGKARADAKHPTVHKTEQPLTVKNDLAPNVNGAEAEMYVLYVLYDSVCTTKKVLPHIGHFLSSEINENITGLKT